MKNIYEVLRRPLVTEKTSKLKEDCYQMTFEVATWAEKVDIARAVKEIFKVDVKAVQTMVYRGKMKRMGRSVGKKRNSKKAIVRLSSGGDLDAFGVVTPLDDKPAETSAKG